MTSPDRAPDRARFPASLMFDVFDAGMVPTGDAPNSDRSEDDDATEIARLWALLAADKVGAKA